MSTFQIALADRAVRPEYASALVDTIYAIGGPGEWLTGAERVAIAEVARHALSVAEPLPPWEAPSSNPETIRAMSDGPISEAMADAAYRIARHSSTLTQRWYEQITSREPNFSDAGYVELVTIVVRVCAADRFCMTASLPLVDLPNPRPGAPRRQRPAPAKVERHWVPTINPKDAGDAFGWLYGTGAAPNVVRALTLVPDAYAEIMPFQSAGYIQRSLLVGSTSTEPARPLSRDQIELVATRTSAANECFY